MNEEEYTHVHPNLTRSGIWVGKAQRVVNTLLPISFVTMVLVCCKAIDAAVLV